MARPRLTLFHATQRDLIFGLERVEKRLSILYVRSGLFDERSAETYTSYSKLPQLGISFTGAMTTGSAYLILDRTQQPIWRTVPQRGGGTKYAMDEVANPSASIFVPSGVYNDDCLISGETMGTDDARSAALNRVFTRELTGGFRSVGGHLVGPEAYRWLELGRRLTHAAGASRECDLALSDALRGGRD